jgi:hypothetical protein
MMGEKDMANSTEVRMEQNTEGGESSGFVVLQCCSTLCNSVSSLTELPYFFIYNAHPKLFRHSF